MGLIETVDILTLVLSLVVFHQAYRTQKSFGGLMTSAFVIFYSVAALSLAIVLLEMSGFIAPDPSPSNIALHIVMFGIQLLLVIGMLKLSQDPLMSMAIRGRRR
jgi:hypothetical protein